MFCGFDGWMHVCYVYSQGGIEGSRHVGAMKRDLDDAGSHCMPN